MTAELSLLEYEALRATIRQRGTARLWLFLAAVVAWGLMLLLIMALRLPSGATLISLLILAAGSEGVAALHFGVERVGRYLQVAYEERLATQTGFGWEHTAMEFGRRFRSAGVDPLFGVVFGLGAFLNLLPVGAAPTEAEQVALVVAHLIFVFRVIRLRRAARRQRAEDLARFRELLSTTPPPAPGVP